MSVSIDTRGFTSMVNDLSRFSNVPPEKIILSESAAILQKCLGSTPALTVRKIEKIQHRFIARFNTYAGGGRAGQGIRQSPNASGIYPRISVAPKAGHTWWIDKGATGDRTFYIMSQPGRKWSDARWAQFSAMNAEREQAIEAAMSQLPRIKKSRGVAKKSWLQIGDNLGITISNVPGYVRDAEPLRGPRVDGVARKVNGASQFFVELENRNQILVRYLDGRGILQRAVSGRLKYFQTNMKKGVFDSIAAVAKKYPGLHLSPA